MIEQLTVSIDAMRKIKSYTAGVDGEVCGLLIINNENKLSPVVEDAVILDQVSSSADTNITTEALIKYLVDISNKKPEYAEKVRGWWHSHYNFNVFWSGIDDKTFRAFVNVMPRAYGIVVNKHGNALARLDIKCKNGKVMTFDEIKLKRPRVAIDKKLMAEAKKKVKIKKYKFNNKWWSKKGGGGYAGFFHGEDYFGEDVYPFYYGGRGYYNEDVDEDEIAEKKKIDEELDLYDKNKHYEDAEIKRSKMWDKYNSDWETRSQRGLNDDDIAFIKDFRRRRRDLNIELGVV